MNSNREEALFAAALAKPANERAPFIEGACHGDAALRQRLAALLAAHERPASALTAGAEAARPTLKLDFGEAPDEAVGQTIGRYKLLEKLGEGGCGVVYVAEQTEPVRRRVALKVIKLGMDTKAVVARFEAERQALAMMDHPNIAKVLDAGTTEQGRPFFVMELVRGIRITDYCDQANLSTKDRLDLFIKVCQAIQHAHQKGIIHRDIKPSNILVTLHDGVPVTKVIDFGIAKATEGRLTDATVYTQLHQFIGTPAYMSPEQAEMSGLDIDTRSDIYSLGVLLYELLAGSTPFDAQELMASGLDAMRQTIREKEPVRPSTRLATLKGDDLTTTARRRSTDTSRLLHQLKGDLDWIVMKCLEKDRTRRYETANGLAADLKRHLDNQPVVARPPSTGYRFQKAFRRNRLAFAAGTAIGAALLVGMISSLWQAARATRAKVEAEASREAAQASEQKAKAAEAGQISLREQAEAQALAARRAAYSSDVNLARQALAEDNLGRAQMLLDRHRPQPGQADLRGWEWRYLWAQTRPDDHRDLLKLTNLVDRIGYSADGRLFGWAARNGQMKVNEVFSGKTVLEQTRSPRLAFAHQSPLLAFAQETAATQEAAVIVLWDTAQRAEVRRLAPAEAHYIHDLAFLPDDRRLIVVSVSRRTRSGQEPQSHLSAWDVDTGNLLWQRPVAWRSDDEGHPFAVSLDGRAIARGIPEGRFQVHDTQSGAELFTVKAAEENVLSLAFSPDGKQILSGEGYVAGVIRIWDASGGAPAGSLEGHKSWVGDLRFTPDGGQLISASADQTIRLWDWAARQNVGILRGHLDEVHGLAFSEGAKTLTSHCKDGSVYLWDLTKPHHHFGYQTLPKGFSDWSFTPDSRAIIGWLYESNRPALFDPFTLKENRPFWPDFPAESHVIFSPNGSHMARVHADGRFDLWDVQTGQHSTNFISEETHEQFLGFGGKTLLTATFADTSFSVAQWEGDPWRSRSRAAFQRGVYRRPEIIRDYFVARTDASLELYDLRKPEQAPRKLASRGMFYGFDLSPDERLGAAAYGEGHLRLWDMATLKALDMPKSFRLGAHSVAFSSDGARIAAGSGGPEAVRLWDVETRNEVLTLSGEGSMYNRIRFSPDGRFLLAGRHVGAPHLWYAPTWEEIAAAEAKEKTETKQL